MMAKKPRKLSSYNRFIARELKGKTGPGYKGRFKTAVAKWKRSNKSGSRPRAKSIPVSKSRPGARAKARPTSGGKRRMGFNQQKIFKIIRIAALAMPAATVAMSTHSTEFKMNQIKKDYFGVGHDGKFAFGNLAGGWLPFIGSIAVTHGIPKIAGIIRSL